MKNKIIITMHLGTIQEVYSYNEEQDIVIINYDVDSGDEDNTYVIDNQEAYVGMFNTVDASVLPKEARLDIDYVISKISSENDDDDIEGIANDEEKRNGAQ